jgi:hypothetical protein
MFAFRLLCTRLKPPAPHAQPLAGYASSGRHRSQRALRAEYERLQRFQRVVHNVVERAKADKTS